ARRSPGWWRLVLPVVWTALLFVWQGTAWVKTMRYFLPVYPTLLVLAGWALATVWARVGALVRERRAPRRHWSKLAAGGLAAVVVLSALAWSFAVTRIYTRTHTRIAASRWVVKNVPGDISLLFDTADGPRELQVGLSNDFPPRDPNQPEGEAELRYSYLYEGVTRTEAVEMPFSGTLVGVRFNHVVGLFDQGRERTVYVSLVEVAGGSERPVLAEAELTAEFEATDDPRGESYAVAFEPVDLAEGGFYRLHIQPDEAGPLLLAGATVATEGQWDDPVPLNVPGYNIWGALYQPLELNMAWEDIPEKRERMQFILDHADYLTISSNRFYDSLRRNPARWPMSLAYYEALFSGELGFELAADFTSPPTLGPITFNDLSAEEAWTVYDHPRVMIWRKTADYDPARTAAILNSADLDEAEHYLIARDTTEPPAELPVPRPRPYDHPTLDAQAAAQTANLFARMQPLGVAIWWLAVAVFGWAAFPALWALLPGLPDRAYPVGRVFGLLFVAWLSWLLASVGALPWARPAMLLSLGVLAAGSALLVWPRRTEFRHWLAENRRHLLIVEGGLAALFVLFVLIRAGNPDLWHPFFGGEKPMDFAYLNAVLGSTRFPPYDPWFAGGTINYYYFGFVIAGLPMKLLGVPSTIGYNLALPTLFALTGGAAFSAAFNLVAPLDPRLDTPGWKPYVAGWQPYLAGTAAMLLAVLLGNLDQIRLVLWGLAELGSGQVLWTFDLFPPARDVLRGLSLFVGEGQPLPVGLNEWYWNATRLIPVPLTPEGAAAEVQPITEFPFFTFLYADLHAHMIAMPLTLTTLVWAVGIVRGAALRAGGWLHAGLLIVAGSLLTGALRPTNTWDYPTYLAIAAAALAIAHFARRGDDEALPALAIGGVAALLVGGGAFATAAGSDSALLFAGAGALVGLLAGYAVGLAATRPEGGYGAHWLALLGAGVQIGLLVALSVLMFLPFIRNYHLGYDTILPWEGSR
ncbi:MAG TPA: DUF2298 domain-containing protein, partial [Aggregatilineales bacterium]|nr:DUF2298 domain-containing protein [Aggregatilineales bacterium]